MAMHVRGRVVEVHGMLVTVRLTDVVSGAADDVHGLRVRVRPPRDRMKPVIGDLCEVELDAVDGASLRAAGRVEARIVAIAPRTRVYERLGVPRQVLAANVDRLVIVSAVDPEPRPGLIDRMWVALADSRVEVLLVVNKCELPGRDAALALLADHARAGATLVPTSTRTGEGVSELAAMLTTGVSVVVGHSGVGKSSLVNALAPGANLLVGDVNEATRKGRHTTTVATCHELSGAPESILVDTPGVRAFSLESLAEAEAAARFPGLAALAQACHFVGCLHNAEPRCAVIAAIAGGSDDVGRHRERWRALALAMREEAGPVDTRNPRKTSRTPGSSGPR